MNKDELSPELKALLDSTPILTDSEITELADANRALAHDPDFIADCIKGDFVNAILAEMDEQGINKNQLATKWGKSRQHISQILDKEKSKNFTIDTIVSLSMTLGLVPQRIELKKLARNAVPIQRILLTEKSVMAPSTVWTAADECLSEERHIAESRTDNDEVAESADTELELAA